MPNFTGHLMVRAVSRGDGRTVLAEQSFRAPYHLSKPYWEPDTRTLLIQVVNPTAGILEGDRLDLDILVRREAALLATTPSASRVFKMKEGSAECHQHFTVENGGWLEVLPEPLVPHRGCRYTQVTKIEVAAGGELFFADLLVAGRVAHGESWNWRRLCLATEVRVAGELVLRERFDQSGADLQSLAQMANAGPSACFANAVLVAEESERDGTWRDAAIALHGEGLRVGLSRLRRGGWSIKLVANNSVELRSGLRRLRAVLASRFSHLACDPRKL